MINQNPDPNDLDLSDPVASIMANVAVAQCLFDIATNPDNPKSIAAAKFWLKCRDGWNESAFDEHGHQPVQNKRRFKA
jgi:hypothetical protein